MKKILSIMFVASTVYAVGMLSSISAHAESNVEVPVVAKDQQGLIESGNLIINGDFSNGFDGWDVGGSTVDLLENDHGNYVELFGYPFAVIDQRIDIDPNSVYEVSYLAYGDRSLVYGNGSLQLNKWTAAGGAADVSRVYVRNTNTWEKYTTIINNGDKKYSRIELEFNAQYFQGLKFTDVVVKKIEE